MLPRVVGFLSSVVRDMLSDYRVKRRSTILYRRFSRSLGRCSAGATVEESHIGCGRAVVVVKMPRHDVLVPVARLIVT